MARGNFLVYLLLTSSTFFVALKQAITLTVVTITTTTEERRDDVPAIVVGSSIIATVSSQDQDTNAASSSSSSSSSSFVVDFLSVGSHKRLDLLEAQRRTFGTHMTVRNLFNVTELDDADPECHQKLTWDTVKQIVNFCKDRRRLSSNSHPLAQYLRNLYAREQWLAKKQNPVGWMCAQPRPLLGLVKAAKYYATHPQQEELPDWFIIVDDDSYINMELFHKTFLHRNSSELDVSAGCLVRQPIHMVNFTFGWGGFGVVISKASFQKLLRPITCPAASVSTTPADDNQDDDDNQQAICDRLQENIAGELRYFQNGTSSLLDIIHAYVSHERYTNVANWTTGFCMHSDWVVGYFVNFYNISRHVSDPYYAAVSHARMEPITQGSEIYKRPDGFCKNEGTCNEGDMICHKMPTEWIEKETERWRQLVPDHFNKMERP